MAVGGVAVDGCVRTVMEVVPTVMRVIRTEM